MSNYGNTNGVNTTAARTGGGTSIVGLLGVAFVVLKLCNVINWSWWLVLLPFYGPVAVCLALAVVCGILYLVFKGASQVFASLAKSSSKK